MAGERIAVWQDDPGEPGFPGQRSMVEPPTDLGDGPLAIALGPEPASDDEEDRLWEELRYWTAADALRRSRAVWSAAVEDGLTWQAGAPLRVDLDAGRQLNAFYDRDVGLQFHVQDVRDIRTQESVRVATGESPDIVAHEIGHAVLDAVKPELWDVTFAEVAAFHEAFGDISALLAALAVREIEEEVVTAPGSVFVSSRVSRIGEEMGWGLRQIRPDLPDPTCLRDAVNSFFYVKPETLPTTSPSTGLSSEPHNFARVFTAAFMRVIDEMLKVEAGVGGTRTRQQVRRVARVSAALLIRAVAEAPIVDSYYNSVALAMVAEARGRWWAKYRKAVTTGFIRTGILTVTEGADIETAAQVPAGRGVAASMRGAIRPALETHRMSLAAFGVDRELKLELGNAAPTAVRRRGVVAQTADDTGQETTAMSSAQFFVEDLFRRNRLDLDTAEEGTEAPIQNPRSVTHRFQPDDDGLRIRRVRVDCGFDVT